MNYTAALFTIKMNLEDLAIPGVVGLGTKMQGQAR
jgi:hypothetical protein